MATVKRRREFLAGLASFAAASAIKPALAFAQAGNTYFTITNASETATHEELVALEGMIKSEMSKIKEFLGPHNLTIGDKSIEIRVTENDRCLSRNGDRLPYLQVPICLYREKVVPTAHELTHILAWNGFSDFNIFLGEGMATYIQNRLGKFYAKPDLGIPFERMTLTKSEFVYRQMSPPSISEAISLIKLNSEGVDNFAQKRWVAYLMAGSFAQYLVEERLAGNIDNIMRLYYKCNNESDWKQMTGVDFKKEEESWRQYLHRKAND